MCEKQKFDLIKEIHVEYNTEIINWLKEKGYKHIIHEFKDFSSYQTKEEIEDKKLYFGFDPDLINKYSKIATFLRWTSEELLEDILKSELRNLEEEPLSIIKIFLNDKDLLELIYNPGK